MRRQVIAWVMALVMCLLVSVPSFSSYADVNDLLMTDSNALMTMELTDEDYGISTYSSINSITNTIDYGHAYMKLRETYNGAEYFNNISLSSSGYGKYIIPDDHSVRTIGISLHKGSLPSPGVYRMQFDFSSDVSIDYSSVFIFTERKHDNAAKEQKSNGLTYKESSGDLYSDVIIQIGSIDEMYLYMNFDALGAGSALGGTFKVNFTPSDEDPQYSTVGIGVNTSEDYQNDVSSSLSDLSSSVGSMTEDLSSAAENLEYISTSQNLIIQGIDNVIVHISDQLYAFWDQLYNLIHVPTMAKMDDIIEAIENVDLQIDVDLDELKTSINNMSQAIQNKLQSVQDGVNNKLQSTTDQITGGYDNSGLESDKAELDTALNSYQDVEDELFEDAKGHISDFEFDTPLDQFIKPLEDISYFMTGIYNGLGGLNIPIQFSLTLTIALIFIGYYRIKR